MLNLRETAPGLPGLWAQICGPGGGRILKLGPPLRRYAEDPKLPAAKQPSVMLTSSPSEEALLLLTAKQDMKEASGLVIDAGHCETSTNSNQ